MVRYLFFFTILYNNNIFIPAVLRVPMFELEKNTIIKIELEYGNTITGLNFHVGNSPTNDPTGI